MVFSIFEIACELIEVITYSGKFAARRILLLFSFLILNFQCISLERGIKSELSFSSSNLAVYRLEKNPTEILLREEMTNFDLKDFLIKKILFSIKKEKNIFQLIGKYSLWDNEINEELVSVIRSVMDSANKGKTYFIVVKQNDKLSPYSRIFRTTLYANRDGNILQLIFGEINNNIMFGNQFSFQDWANPSFFPIRCEKKKIVGFEGKYESAFHFRIDKSCEEKNTNQDKKSLNESLLELNNYKWVLIDLDKIFEIEKNGLQGIQSENQESREKRLNELMKLHKKGLIDKDDYEMKKAEILGDI